MSFKYFQNKLTALRLVLPVQVVPMYPLTHAHCDDKQSVLASTSVH